jgi:hypothetical protein
MVEKFKLNNRPQGQGSTLMKSEIKVFDPPMCCSSGVCGASVNPKLVQFAGDLDELKQRGVTVSRFNLSSEPAAFVAEPLVKEALAKEGNGCLPLILVNGSIVSKGNYPTRNELMQWAGLDAGKTLTPAEKSKTKDSDCGPDCSCNCAPSGKKLKIIVSSVVLIAVLGILSVKFATAKTTGSAAVSNGSTTAFPVEAMTSAKPAPATAPVSAFEKLNTLSDLNTVAINQDAVLVFIPSPGNTGVPAATDSAMRTAQKTLQKSKMALGLYTLAETAPDYPMISAQTKAPAILVAAKGRGMLAIPADTTESKILQAFMSASSGGGCGTSSGCGPSTAGCK